MLPFTITKSIEQNCQTEFGPVKKRIGPSS